MNSGKSLQVTMRMMTMSEKHRCIVSAKSELLKGFV